MLGHAYITNKKSPCNDLGWLVAQRKKPGTHTGYLYHIIPKGSETITGKDEKVANARGQEDGWRKVSSGLDNVAEYLFNQVRSVTFVHAAFVNYVKMCCI